MTVKVLYPPPPPSHRWLKPPTWSCFDYYFVWLYDFYYESYLAPCFHVFSILFSIKLTSLGEERELVYMLLEHLFVYLACITVRLFSLPLGVRDWLQLVIVALKGLFIYFYYTHGVWYHTVLEYMFVSNTCDLELKPASSFHQFKNHCAFQTEYMQN